MRDKLKKAKTVNLTIDLWSNRQMQSYIGITGHYISEEWSLESFVLGCNRVVGQHTAENLMLWYDEIVSDFCVSEKVKHVITDSAANIKKAFTALPGYEDDLGNNGEPEEEAEESEEDNATIDPDQSLFDENLLLEHHSFFAHSIQLVVKDGIAKAGQIGNVIKKCSKLVSFVRKSTIAADVLKDEKRLQADNVTRWNSQLKMIISVLAIDERKFLEFDDAPKLTTHEQNILHDLVEILTPFEEATDFVQVGCVPSAGYVLPCIRGLNHHMQSVVSKYNSSFVTALKLSLKKRVPYYEEIETYLLATILDPRFKLRWSNEAEKESLIDLLKGAVKKLELPSTAEQDQEQSEEPCPKKVKALFSFMPDADSGSSLSRSQSQSSGAKEVDEYLQAGSVSMQINPLKFWKENEKKYPLMVRLARDVLGVPSSSSPVEQLFSVAGKVFSPERYRLTDTRFEQLMFIRCNNHNQENEIEEI